MQGPQEYPNRPNMKSRTLILASCVSSILVISGCKKSTPPETSLEITVSDELGNKVSGASVTLFLSESDWENGTNQSKPTQLTDVNGKVKFTPLISTQYYWAAGKDCKNNYNGSNTISGNLTPNTNTQVSTIITSTGTLKFVNISSFAYSIFLNGTLSANIPPTSTKILPMRPIGGYVIRVEQIGGSTIKTYTGNLTCGSTLVTTFP